MQNHLLFLITTKFNLIRAQQLIPTLTALPIEEQTYLFANMMLNKN